MAGPFTSMYVRREELEKHLTAVVETLQAKGILSNDLDKEALVKKTAENIGDFSKENLNDPAIQLKMAIALIATSNHQDNPENMNLDWLFKKDMPPDQVEKEIDKIIEEFHKQNPEGAKRLDELINEIIIKLSTYPDSRPSPSNKTAFITDDAGVPQVYLYGETKPLATQAGMIFSLLIANHADLPKVLEDEAFPERFSGMGPRPTPY